MPIDISANDGERSHFVVVGFFIAFLTSGHLMLYEGWVLWPSGHRAHLTVVDVHGDVRDATWAPAHLEHFGALLQALERCSKD